MHTDRQTGGRAYIQKHTYIQTGQTYIHTETDRQTETEADPYIIHTYIHTGIHTYIQADRHTYIHTYSNTYTHIHTYRRT